jgi:hypothetical protein
VRSYFRPGKPAVVQPPLENSPVTNLELRGLRNQTDFPHRSGVALCAARLKRIIFQLKFPVKPGICRENSRADGQRAKSCKSGIDKLSTVHAIFSLSQVTQAAKHAQEECPRIREGTIMFLFIV